MDEAALVQASTSVLQRSWLDILGRPHGCLMAASSLLCLCVACRASLIGKASAAGQRASRVDSVDSGAFPSRIGSLSGAGEGHLRLSAPHMVGQRSSLLTLLGDRPHLVQHGSIAGNNGSLWADMDIPCSPLATATVQIAAGHASRIGQSPGGFKEDDTTPRVAVHALHHAAVSV